MTRIGLSFVLRSRTRQTAKIAAMAQFVSASATASPAQTAFARIRTPAEAIMATTAGRGCQRTGYARKPCPDKRGRVDRNRAGVISAMATRSANSCRLSQLCCVTITYPLPNVNALRYSVERNSFFSTCFLLFIRFVSNLTRPCAALL